MPTTRRYPRSLTEAFGPYASGPIEEAIPPMHPADKVIVTLGCAVLVGVITAVIAGWL